MKFISHPEGYIEPDGAGGYEYVYQYKDHLGNIRLSYSDANDDGIVNDSEIVEESNYYPFGLLHRGYNNAMASSNIAQNWKYNGKELDEDSGLNLYHYGFRLYDPILGRFPSIDPISDEFPHVSTYNYAENSPILNVDLWGLQAYPYWGDHAKAYEGKKSARKPKQSDWKGKWSNNAALRVVGAATIVLGGTGAVLQYGRSAVGAFVLQEAAESAFESITGIPVITDPVDIIQTATKKGLFKGLTKMESHEKTRVAELLADGSTVKQIKRSDTPTADFEIDGKIVEFKALTGDKLNINTAITRLKSGTKKDGVEIIDLDIRKVGGNKGNAQEIYERFKGTDAGKSFKGQVRIATKDGLINF